MKASEAEAISLALKAREPEPQLDPKSLEFIYAYVREEAEKGERVIVVEDVNEPVRAQLIKDGYQIECTGYGCYISW
jgi:hypothetical protein